MLELTPLVWTLTSGLNVVLLAVDLVSAAIRPHKVGFREAVIWSGAYVAAVSASDSSSR